MEQLDSNILNALISPLSNKILERLWKCTQIPFYKWEKKHLFHRMTTYVSYTTSQVTSFYSSHYLNSIFSQSTLELYFPFLGVVSDLLYSVNFKLHCKVVTTAVHSGNFWSIVAWSSNPAEWRVPYRKMPQRQIPGLHLLLSSCHTSVKPDETRDSDSVLNVLHKAQKQTTYQT